MSDDTLAADLEVAKALSELRQRFARKLPDTLQAITALFESLSAGSWAPAPVIDLHRMAHSLAGTAGTFGLPEVSHAARRLETSLQALLDAGTAPTDGSWSELTSRVHGLRSACQAGGHEAVPRSAPPPEAGPRTEGLVHLIVGSADRVRPLQAALALEGFRSVFFDHPQAFRIAASQTDFEWPTAVVFEADSAGAAEALASQIEQLGLSRRPGLPLLVGLTQPDLATRIAAARAGARRCLDGPLAPETLIEALHGLSTRVPQQPWRVLLVDDEPLVLQAHAVYLQGAGMDVHTLSDPMKTLEAVEQLKPDVLVLDVYMPGVRGPEIAAALRESNACQHLAIVFLSAETDTAQQMIALDLGGDDFLIKPVQPAHLVAAVTARARRARHNQLVQRRLETMAYERQREHLALNEHAIVSMTDADGNITYANDLFCKTSGYRRDEILGQNHRLIESGEHPPAFYQSMWDTIRRGHVWQGELCSRRKDGSPFWVECTITPFLDSQGIPYQYVSIRTDISHIKATEAAIRRQRDMQRMVSVAAAILMAASAQGANEAIQAALRASGELLGAQQAIVFRVSRDGSSMRNTHHWRAPGSPKEAGNLAQVPLGEYGWMRQRLMHEGLLVIPDAYLLPLEAGKERHALAAVQARAMIALPMLKNGGIVGFVGYSAPRAMPEWSRDICEILTVLGDVIAGALGRQRAESDLRESEARLSFLVSTSPVTIYTRQAQEPCPFTYVSPNIQALMGLDPAEFIEQPGFWADGVHPDDRNGLVPLPTFLEGTVHQCEYRLRNKEGEYRWVQDQVRLARDESSGESKLVGYWMDITERKRIEGELQRFNQELEHRVSEQTQSVIESERFARATLDALDARVAILDDGGHILAVNRAWRESRVNQINASGMLEGHNYLRFCDNLCGLDGPGADGLRPIAEGIQAVIRGDTNDYFHEYACPLATEPRWFVCRVKRFPGDSAVRVVVSHEDITDMKLVERQQMRSQRLESLGTLAGGVAHDLNNSLAPILMGMGILQDQFPQEQKLISMIHNSAKRGADMVRQLITFAKGVDGQRVAVQPDHLVRELESLMKGSFPKNIELQIDTEPGLPAVLGDATQLHQILLNLCVNARDAMPHGGTLSVEARAIELDASQVQAMNGTTPGRYVRLRVSDTGDGIRPDILDRIFDPFFTTKSQDKGTGLGLSTVLGIVKGHKGNVQVSSTLGKGTTFTVHLPLSQGEVALPGANDSGKAFQGRGESILFVDDEPALQEVGKAVLERLNFKVIVAVDGEDGLIKATENRATLKAIITDMHMPHMDGLAFVHAVRRTLPDIPIILASGRVDDAVARDFRALGVKARLDKPFSETQLADKLRVLLSASAEQN